MSAKTLRCAIYTRKSSEEGLDQDFNSLHAQREACEAYIKSQRHEGWKLIPDAYDDGGISGGTMQRPALLRLLEDIKAKQVDIIVVYKVDRLTRSLADFARMVELFDEHQVSFVSVTQQFNTTSSMGRLTLNVLLSFAQFEREVTGERIRDKIKASKAKGMWMGGNVPYGYRVKDRKLLIHQEEATTVKLIFETYLEVGSVRALLERLNHLGLMRPKNPMKAEAGMVHFSRGGLATMLCNPIYFGKVRHGKVLHQGLHQAILSQSLWDQVQQKTHDNTTGPKPRNRVTEPSPLLGKLFDAEGRRLVPCHTKKPDPRNKTTRRRRYYISETLRRGSDPTGWRLPAKPVESLVLEHVKHCLTDPTELLSALGEEDKSSLMGLVEASQVAATQWSMWQLIEGLVERVEVRTESMTIMLNLSQLHPDKTAPQKLTFASTLAVKTKKRGNELRLVIEGQRQAKANLDEGLLITIARAQVWWDDWLTGRIKSYDDIVKRDRVSASYVGDVMKLAFLSPKLVQDIVHGRQSEMLMVSQLTKVDTIPMRWNEQDEAFACSYGK